MKQTVLITGGSGLLAFNWGLTIRDEFSVTLGLHKRNVSMAGVSTSYISLDSVESILGVIAEVKPDIIIHTAGLSSIEDCEDKPDLAYQINVVLAENVAKACALQAITLVHISTDHLFSGEHQMVEEDEPPEPVNVYAKTKAEAESRVLDGNPEALVIRTNFYGWGPSYRQSFSDFIIKALANGKSPTLYQDIFYTPIFTDELVHSVNKLVKHKAQGIFHVVGDERLSKYDFGLKIASHFRLDTNLIKPGFYSEQSSKVSRPFDMSLSNKKSCELLGGPLGKVDDHLQLLKGKYSKDLERELKQF